MSSYSSGHPISTIRCWIPGNLDCFCMRPAHGVGSDEKINNATEETRGMISTLNARWVGKKMVDTSEINYQQFQRFLFARAGCYLLHTKKVAEMGTEEMKI